MVIEKERINTQLSSVQMELASSHDKVTHHSYFFHYRMENSLYLPPVEAMIIGVPVILGKNGIEKIVELDINATEKAHMTESAKGVRNTNDLLDV